MPVTLQQAIATIKSGDKETGKIILIQLLQQEPENDKAWVWMTAVVDTDDLRLECLETALSINPNNQTAQKGTRQLRHKLGLPDQEEEEALPFPEVMHYGSTPARTVTYPKEMWSYDKYKPEPPPLAKPTLAKQIGEKGKQTFLATPFFTILFAPRETVQTILEVAPKRYLLFLSILIGIFNVINGALNFYPLELMPGTLVLVVALLIGPIYGIVYFYIAGFIFSMSGFILGGEGTTGEVRAALLWANVPRLYLFPVQGLITYLLVQNMASPNDMVGNSADVLTLPLFLLICVAAAVGLWLFYVHLECLGAAHKISAWRAWATLLLPSFLLFTILCGALFLTGVADSF